MSWVVRYDGAFAVRRIFFAGALCVVRYGLCRFSFRTTDTQDKDKLSHLLVYARPTPCQLSILARESTVLFQSLLAGGFV